MSGGAQSDLADVVVPLMAGDWRPLDPDEAAAFLERLILVLSQTQGLDAFPRRYPVTGLRAMPLSFYPGWLLVEGEAQLAAESVGTFDVLWGPGLMWLIDGDSGVVHDLNSGRLPRDLGAYLSADAKLLPGPSDPSEASFVPRPLAPWTADQTVPDFVRFFCACVWGAEGPFYVLEDGASPLLNGLASDHQAWREKAQPMSVVSDRAGYQCEVMLVYAGSLYKARFGLSTAVAGVVMIDDEVVSEDALPKQVHRSPFRHVRPRAQATVEQR